MNKAVHHTLSSLITVSPPTGKKVAVTGIDMTRWADGKAVEHWANQDLLGLMQQLGVLPPMG